MSSPSLPPQKSADEVLPPVAAPTKGFLLQLFFIPMIIVAIIVTVWFMFSWLAQMGTDPAELARNLKTHGSNRWQDAMTLSDLLRNPEFEKLKDDEALARELSGVLAEQIRRGGDGSELIKMRVFLCRTLGEFRTLAALPALVGALQHEESLADISVRRSALEAIALLADNVGGEKLHGNEELYAALRSAALERGAAGDEQRERDALRAAAAFTLGVVGGEASLDLLARMLSDPHANARFNAATGLARHGDERAAAGLLQMLDPDNEYAVEGEETKTGQDWKRMQVAMNGIKGAQRLAEENKTADLSALEDALRRLTESDLSQFTAGVRRGIRLSAEEALDSIHSRRQTALAD